MSTPSEGLRGSRLVQGLGFFLIFTILSLLLRLLLGTAFSWGLVLQQAIMGAFAAVLFVILMALYTRRRDTST